MANLQNTVKRSASQISKKAPKRQAPAPKKKESCDVSWICLPTL
jgi:hypothetical protein